MSISLKRNSPHAAAPNVREAVRYAFAAAGCAVFAFIYAQFSHGVHSPFMSFMFLVPLIGGAAFALVRHAAGAPACSPASRKAWALAIASLTLASCLRGIFDIAGTGSRYLAVYLVLAAAFAVAAFVMRKRG